MERIFGIARDQNDVQINGNFCGGIITDMFVKNGELKGPGKHRGRCGNKKDHSRTFCCKDCYNMIF